MITPPITTADFLIEIGTEELPAKSSQELVANFAFNIEKGLQNAGLVYSQALAYVGTRRLAVLIKDLANKQEDQVIEKRGPALSASFNDDGSPTQACLGFASSCGIGIAELEKYKTSAGAWVLCRKKQIGERTVSLMPSIIEEAISNLQFAKGMRWGSKDIVFVRPVRWVVMLYGEELIRAHILGVATDRITWGHRFHCPNPITLTNATEYVSALATKGHVLVDFEHRKEMIRDQLADLTKTCGALIIDDDLLNEVTGMVEWPVALLCSFSEKFLNIPAEALMAVMRNHQRCFYSVEEKGKLLPYFVTISNIESKKPERVIRGNERVMHARLSDIEFFYRADLQHPLDDYVERLHDVLYRSELGTLRDKVSRLVHLTAFIAEKIGADVVAAKRAAFLAKADLMTEVVNELPELQGIMGYYYALQQKESEVVAMAIREHYLPRYSGDTLPGNIVAVAVALADRIDSLVGIFGIDQIPSGDKDPFGLRRAALAIIKIILEMKLPLDLKELLEVAKNSYPNEFKKNLVPQILDFIFERLRSWYLEQGVAANAFHAVLARSPVSLLDFQRRLEAIESFQKLPQATSLIAAHKRVNNIIKKAGLITQTDFITDLLEDDAEKELAAEINMAEQIIQPLFAEGFYSEALKILAELKTSIDRFFDGVMVMVTDEKLRNNRLALLVRLRDLFSYVADISLL